MSAIAPSQGYPPHWITPLEQLEQLGQIESAISSKVANVSPLFSQISDVVASYAFAPNSQLTIWHSSLRKINKLPRQLPPLPVDTLQFLDGPCPEQICNEKKPDGTPYTLGEKSVLLLLSEELGSLKTFTESILAYGAIHYGEEGSLFYCRYARKEAYQDAPANPTQWALVPKNILQGSRNVPYETQVNLVHSLSQETLVNWTVPEISKMLKAIFLIKIGTETMLYGTTNDNTYTRLSNQALNQRLAIGGCSANGINIIGGPNYCASIGMTAIGTFKSE